MKRRLFLAAALVLPFATLARGAPSWSARLVTGGFDGKAYSAGLLITLEEGWKTYWRNPGSAGIPPDIKGIAENLASLSVDFPLPQRIVDDGGTAFGYHGEVLFPLTITPKDAASPVALHLASFFGVCQQICSPAKFEADLTLAPTMTSGADTALLSEWKMKVPQLTAFFDDAEILDKHLHLVLKAPVQDIFVEGPDRYYFSAPEFDGLNVKLKISGLKNDADLKAIALRLTAVMKGQGVEQNLTLA
jgi:DsbC/DsbD-like thiol-disulfide interchange protein